MDKNTPKNTPPKKSWEKEADEMDALDKRGKELVKKHGIVFKHTDNSLSLGGGDVDAYDRSGTHIGRHSWIFDGSTNYLGVHPDFKGTALTHLLLKHSIDFSNSKTRTPLIGSYDTTPASTRLMRTYFPKEQHEANLSDAPFWAYEARPLSHLSLTVAKHTCLNCGGEGTTPKTPVLGKQLSEYDTGVTCSECKGSGLTPYPQD